MDFFASQERAERQTRLMLLLFLTAVVLTVLALDLLAGIVVVIADNSHAPTLGAALRAVPAPVYWGTTAVVLAVVLGGTLYRISSLSGGGAAVAEMVGARRINSPGASAAEQRLVNVVEEMAIAAGIRVPLLYVMDDQRGINAFAAGYAADQAAVVVTQGTLDQLSRDELQGVVAHEFSHILNGDMRLNIRLVGIVAGLVFIGSIGSFLMRLGSGGDEERIGRQRGDFRVFALGLAIWLIGSVGVFFGSLIKAAVSRQREFLADASAVRYTRNPEGIAGALARIGQLGSGVRQLHAEELSHMYFGSATDNFFATHPPIETRIERILGAGAAVLFQRKFKQAAAPVAQPVLVNTSDTVAIWADGAEAPVLTPTSVFSSIGNPAAPQVGYAHRLIEGLPAEVRRTLDTPAGAKAALCALLLNGAEVRQRQLGLIAAADNQMTAEAAERLAGLLAPLGPRMRLPVLTLAMASLRSLDVVDRDALVRLTTDLVHADGKVTLGEFVLLTLCRSQLQASLQRPARARHTTLAEATGSATTILTLMARTAKADPAAALAKLGLTAAAAPAALTFPAVDAALAELKLLAPDAKGRFVDACIHIAMADDHLTVAEAELLRAFCAALEVPLPPFVERLHAA